MGSISLNFGDDYSNILITENTISESASPWAGIEIRGTVSDLTITYNNLTDNPGGGIEIGDSDGICTWGTGNVINYNNIVDNAAFGIDVDGSSVITGDLTVDAENNWWGDASGPLNADTNADGLGDSVTNKVDFDPFSTVEN